jgi:hypothetical protein
MNYKTLFQVILIILALSLSTLIYFKYFFEKSHSNYSQNAATPNSNKQDLSEDNTIKEIVYESFDNKGNKYIIKSDFGTLSDKQKEEILMTNVTAQILFKNGTFMDLTSKNAKYYTFSSDTYFFNNVELKYLDHKINSNNIDVLFKDNKLEAYNDLVYRNPDIKLLADKVEVDLLTQDTKIFMFDNSKVKIVNN